MSGDDLAVSGTADIPIQEFSVAFPILPDQKQVDSLGAVEPGDRCHNSLREINKDSGTDILRPEKPSGNPDDLYNARLYIADTDPRFAGGGNGLTDYDTVYVDNKTRCQFSPSEGPFYINDYFNYSNRNAGARFQFKNVTGSADSRKLVYHNASQVLRLRQPTRRQMNGVDTLVSFDTVNLTKASLPDYQLIVFRRDDSLTYLRDEKERLNAFADRGGSLLLLMNLEDSDFSNDFLSSSDLSYISDMDNTGRGDIEFSDSSSSRSLRQFFKGVSGSASVPGLEPAGKVSSTGDSGTAEQPLLSYKNTYDRDDWNASDFSMDDADTVPNGAPESECYPPSGGSPPDGSLTEGSLQFPDDDDTETYEILNAELGGSDNFCQNNDLRSLMIDLDDDESFESQEREGPFVEGDVLEWQGRTYNLEFLSSDGEGAELVFIGSTSQEAINYVPSYGEGKLAATGYSAEYGSETRNLLAATMYQLLPENSVFGSGSSSASLEVLSSTNQSFYMPYTANLRWSRG
nr:MAG: hypothetical protein J07AB56_07680 [Candidatus Nanosalinarum sp. J07AB56]